MRFILKNRSNVKWNLQIDLLNSRISEIDFIHRTGNGGESFILAELSSNLPLSN